MAEQDIGRRQEQRREKQRGDAQDRRQEKRRKDERESIDIPVAVNSATDSVEGSIISVSAGGGAVAFSSELGKTHQGFDIGMDVELATSNETKLQGSVVRNYDGGFAVEFNSHENVLDLLNNIVSEK